MSALIGVRKLVRHAREEFGFEPIRSLDLLRLPLQSSVLLGEVCVRGADPLFQLAVQLLERLVQVARSRPAW
jgi:hypothetical protein